MAKQPADEMDLSREDRQRRDEELPRDCPCCEHPPRKQSIFGQTFPHRVQCSNESCGIATPWTKLDWLAVLIWNRRPHVLIDKKPASEHTAGSKPNRRSSARSQAAGKRVSARKAAHTTKESSK